MVLSWIAATGANKYHLQVSTTPDFSGTLIVDDNTLGSATDSFTDTGADDSKRWWRWRFSTNSGSTWSTWRIVGSYWLRAGATDLTYSAPGWYLIADADTSDVYKLDPFPQWKISTERIDRTKTRNRAGDLLSEYLTLKDHIALSFPETTFIEPEFVAEVNRFSGVIKTFFVACFRATGQIAGASTEIVPQIWRCQFEADPSFDMIGAGYQFTSQLAFQEA